VAVITTSRLVLRRWHEGDVAAMAAFNADPEVMRWIGDGSVRTLEQTRASIEAWEQQWRREGFGLFALELRATGELAGFTGLSRPEFLPEVMPAVEIGWRLGRRFWGQGLATEAATAALRFGFIDCGLERIVSIAQVGNDNSERIMAKLGMHLERETVDPGARRRVRVHMITRAGYMRTARRIDRIKACLNGGRGRDEHPAVPLAPAELAREAASAVAAGAEAVHLHPRSLSGAESLAPGDVGAAVAAVRQACPGTPVGVSTGLWITGEDMAARRGAVAAWAGLEAAARPDFASVNVSEPGLTGLLDALAAAGVAAEAGVWSVADARTLASASPPDGWLRVLVEVIDVPAAGAVAAADEILRELDRSGVAVPRLLHGEEDACWPLVRHAGLLGLPTRVGLEDTTTGPGGRQVGGNAELVALALAEWAAARPR
jgi:RimJ/RimL family protein N-acetyltransferase/uncharacterized protein (DUF849 family)